MLSLFVSSMLIQGVHQGEKVFQKESVTVQVGNVLDIEANVPEGSPYTWAVPKQEGIEFRSSGLTGFVFAKIPGTYCVGLAYGKVIKVAWINVVVTKDAILPDPKPPTPPILGEDSLTLMVIYDKIPSLPPFSGQTMLTDYMLQKGHKWKLVDVNGKDSRGILSDPNKFIASIPGKTPPWLLIHDGITIRASLSLPTSWEDMLKTLQGPNR